MRKIAVFTGSRAEYGFLRPVLKAIAADPGLEYFLLVSGAHLQEEFGRTIAEIESDGFEIFAKVDLGTHEDSLLGTVQSIGREICSLSKILDHLAPDILVVPADRFEGLAAVIVGSQMNIPVAHIEGGDYTEGGSLDDSVRHAMTKLSHLHFVTNEPAAIRVGKLGEEPWRIHNVGLPILDMVKAGDFGSPEDVAHRLGLDLSRPIVLFCQHSVTTEVDSAEGQVSTSLEALETLAREDKYQVIITYPNNDAGGRKIIQRIQSLEQKNISGIQVHKHLGRPLFHGVMNVIGRVGKGAFVGNSSSGIKETPSFGCPTVNIGTRQQGRLRAGNVIDVAYDTLAIISAIRRCVKDSSLRQSCSGSENPYGSGNAGQKVVEILASVPIGPQLLQKKMTY
jgi:UDP-N-acetylglucosamine 2-epimerase (non-hydrolysing)/GDP/UDP-N,N'-diacetylbacillosamine 2-epimerase (hydrolysing)